MELEEKIEKARSDAMWCRRHPKTCAIEMVEVTHDNVEVAVWCCGPGQWIAQASGPTNAPDGGNLYILSHRGPKRDTALSKVLVELDAFVASWKAEPSGSH